MAHYRCYNCENFSLLGEGCCPTCHYPILGGDYADEEKEMQTYIEKFCKPALKFCLIGILSLGITSYFVPWLWLDLLIYILIVYFLVTNIPVVWILFKFHKTQKRKKTYLKQINGKKF